MIYGLYDDLRTGEGREGGLKVLGPNKCGGKRTPEAYPADNPLNEKSGHETPQGHNEG